METKQLQLVSIREKKGQLNRKEYQPFSFLTDYQSKEVNSKENFLTPGLELKNRITTKGKIKFCTNDFITSCKYSKKELTNQSVSKITHPEMPKTVFKSVINELAKGNETIAIVRHIDKLGNSFWMNTHYIPNKGDNLNIAFSTKSIPTSRKTYDKVNKIYNTLFLLEKHADKDLADKYFNGLIEMEYGNYDGFTLDAFI